nr:type VI secretion system accessory protein TagJ [Mangrovicoccus algicola]
MVRNGDLGAGLTALQAAIRAAPADARLRIFLFQLLCLTGDWSRALAQARLAAQMDAAALPMAQAYREAILCEVFREKVFAGEKQPLVLGAPGGWIATLIEALRPLAAGDAAAAAALRDTAFAAAPASPGRLNGAPFAWIADADSRLGPVLEAVVNGKYYWLPFAAIRRIAAEPPADLRDAVWMPCQITLEAGGDCPAFLPARYPGTAAAGSDAERLARATRWQEAGDGTWTGTGQRMLATDTGEFPLLELRLLEIGEAADE